MFPRKMSIAAKLIVGILVLVLEEGQAYFDDEGPKPCYVTAEKRCYYPDYYIHWTGVQCVYGSRGGPGECFIWLEWYMLWLYAAVGLTFGLGCLGCFCAPLFGWDLCAGCMVGSAVGYCLPCPCCAIPCLWYVYSSDARCELCGQKFRSNAIKEFSPAYTHKEACLKNNKSQLDQMPNSSLYKCKNCKNMLKLWPINKLEKSKCIKCENEIVNNGSNLHICFTCISVGTQHSGQGSEKGCSSKVINHNHWTNHHLCSRHTEEGNVIEVNFEDFASIPSVSRFIPSGADTELVEIASKEGPATSSLPPGWKVLTNPVTGAPYGLCDPSGNIKPLANENVPPPYEEAVASHSEQPLLSVKTFK